VNPFTATQIHRDRPQLGVALGLREAGEYAVERVAPRDLGEAAREPDLVDAHRREQAHRPLELLEAEKLVARKPFQAFRRHAVAAAEVAFVRDGHTHAADRAAPRVDERLHEPFHARTPGKAPPNTTEEGT